MSALFDQQRALQVAIMGGAEAGALLRSLPGREPLLRVYQHAYGTRLVGALSDNFGVLPQVMGDEAFDAADALAIDASAFAGIAPDAWPGLRFTLLPSVQLLSMQWAVEPVWKAMQSFDADSGEEPELPEPQEHEHALLIWRQGLENRWRSIDATQASLLRAVMNGKSFGELCELAAENAGADQAAAVAVSALQAWLADGLLCGVTAGG